MILERLAIRECSVKWLGVEVFLYSVVIRRKTKEHQTMSEMDEPIVMQKFVVCHGNTTVELDRSFMWCLYGVVSSREVFFLH